MDNFDYTKKETYTQQEVDILLTQHDKYKTSTLKNEFDNKEKEYQIKLNNYQEKELFNGLDEKKITLAKSLMNNEEYKTLSKEEAFKKIKQDYNDIFNKTESKQGSESKQEIFNFADLTKLNDTLENREVEKLESKAKTKGLTSKEETENYVRQVFKDIK